MSGYGRPTPSPIRLWARPEMRRDLVRLVRSMERERIDASKLGVAVLQGDDVDDMRVLISYGDLSIGLPVLGAWPLDDLSPLGILALLQEIERDACTHETIVTRHASIAVELCLHHGRLPCDAATGSDGSCMVEVCIDGNMDPVFWVQRTGRNGQAYRLDVDPAELERHAGRMRLPCHLYSTVQQGRAFDTVGISISEEEGIEVEAEPLDAMSRLRLYRDIAAHAAGNQPDDERIAA